MFRKIVSIGLISRVPQVTRRNIEITKRYASTSSRRISESDRDFAAASLGVITILGSIIFVSPWELKSFLPSFGRKERNTAEPNREPGSEETPKEQSEKPEGEEQPKEEEEQPKQEQQSEESPSTTQESSNKPESENNGN
ncbi:hypothetical protein ZYGR_0H01310 [Zygosaccharomyces rouxii]|uniref:ZYRO0B07040p n=2 Tax=Zygosaccharomyces rouxii TaxID=4956 RepID=C5DRB1_ZYGRC|nr:uncharacterized protein ZYRO0B07040g [Zygosaccharomyces rouxii]KAH9200135.1 hypothetical protein LQ764DRAFT_113246 [Zygosaccharomyces rouxii]GAV47290.1 hypothetical protein ZYGR_0H01310 [Zygosaccharomyces rouxii]CAR26322.1 ZYRO0B07040p [Zygosaccharomyces rouxii]